MTSLGVWTVSNPFLPGLKNPGLENGSFLEVASNVSFFPLITLVGKNV